MVLLWIPCWSVTWGLPASVSQVLVLQACTAMPGSSHSFNSCIRFVVVFVCLYLAALGLN
jgi:uncharacterized membrane protein YgaE (UPF0421/DUF939 family)